jgi:hypothetical protein
MFIVAVVLAIALWAVLFRGREIGARSLALLWLIVVAVVGSYFYVELGLEVGSWSAPADSFVTAALLALLPSLFLVGLVEIPKFATSGGQKRAMIRVVYSIATLALWPLLKYLSHQFQAALGPSPDVTGVAQAFGYGGYVMVVLAMVALALGLVSAIRDRRRA